MELQTLQVQARDGRGKGPARRARKAGQVPAVVYGEGQDPVQISVDTKTFDRITHGAFGQHAIVNLEVTDKPEWNGPALIKDVQHDPLRSHVLHADFLRISLDKRLHTEVPVVLKGRSKGILDGGVSDHQLHEIEIECVALDVPAAIEVDITNLGIGESIHVSDIVAPEGVTILTDAERTIVAIHAPRVAETAPAEGEPTEPAKVGEEDKD